MRALKIICGIAVIVTTLHLGHGIHHFSHIAAREGMHGLALWAAEGAAAVVGIFSLIGGCLLFSRA
jgi:hypothetical protein